VLLRTEIIEMLRAHESNINLAVEVLNRPSRPRRLDRRPITSIYKTVTAGTAIPNVNNAIGFGALRCVAPGDGARLDIFLQERDEKREIECIL